MELAVTITNVKNQPPQWEMESYSVVIPENTARDTPIVVRVHVTLIAGTVFILGHMLLGLFLYLFAYFPALVHSLLFRHSVPFVLKIRN